MNENEREKQQLYIFQISLRHVLRDVINFLRTKFVKPLRVILCCTRPCCYFYSFTSLRGTRVRTRSRHVTQLTKNAHGAKTFLISRISHRCSTIELCFFRSAVHGNQFQIKKPIRLNAPLVSPLLLNIIHSYTDILYNNILLALSSSSGQLFNIFVFIFSYYKTYEYVRKVVYKCTRRNSPPNNHYYTIDDLWPSAGVDSAVAREPHINQAT